MVSIPEDFYHLCRSVFLQCDEFDSDRSLHAIFVIEKLKPFQDGLRTATSKRDRVDWFLDYLQDKRFGNGEPALLIFLEVLRDRYPEENALRDELNECVAATTQIWQNKDSGRQATQKTVSQGDRQDKKLNKNIPCAVILTAISVEYKAVRAHLTELQEEVHPQGTVYERGKFAANGMVWDVAIVEIGAGNTGSAMEAERAIAHFKPNVILFVGVAGGIKDVSLGDVVAATKVYGYESGKAKLAFEPRPDVGLSTYKLTQRARAEAKKDDWLQRLKPNIPSPAPNALVAPIAAGEKVIASKRSSLLKFLQSSYGDAIAVEMEGRGLLQAAHANEPVLALIVRGISDLISNKSKTDKDGWQEIAARHASAFAFEVLAKFYGDDTQDSSPQNSFPPQTLNVERGTPIELSSIKKNADMTRKALNPITLERISRDCVQLYLKEISSSVDNDERKVIAIIGDAGYGKTTILGDIYDDIRSKAGWVALVRCDNLSLEQNLSVESLAIALGKYVCDNKASASLTDIASSLTEKHGRGVVLIDTLDIVLNQVFIEPFHQILRELTEKNTTIVFTCRDYEYDNILNPDVNFYTLPSNVKRHPVPRFSNSEIIKAAQVFFEEKSKKLNAINKGKAFGEEIVDRKAHDYQLREIICKPLLLRMLCELCEDDGVVPQNLTASKLYGLYWNDRIAKFRLNSSLAIDVSPTEVARKQQKLCWNVAKTAFDTSYERLEILVRISDLEEMEEFDKIDDLAYEKLRSEGVLVTEKKQVDLVRFFHQSFMEYAIASWLDKIDAKDARERLLEILREPNASFDWWRIMREYLTIARPTEFKRILNTNKLDINNDRAFYAVAFATASRDNSSTRDDSSALDKLLPIALAQGTKYQKILFEAAISTPTSQAEATWKVILTLLREGEHEIAANIAQKSREMLARLRPHLGSCIDAALFAIKERTIGIKE